MGFVGLILTGWFIAPLISVRDKSPPDLLLRYFLKIFWYLYINIMFLKIKYDIFIY
jgi:hypothetical protein